MSFRIHRLTDGYSLIRSLAELLFAATPITNAIGDLSDTVVIVPAARAKRSLEGHLLELAKVANATLFLPDVMSPGGLARRFVVPPETILDTAGVHLAWQKAITVSPLALRTKLFSELAHGQEPSDASINAITVRVASMHREAAGAGIGFEEIARELLAAMPEADLSRWEALQELERGYQAQLQAAHAIDAPSAARLACTTGSIHTGPARRVFILLADPDRSQRELLRVLDRAGLEINVAVHAMGSELPAPLDAEGFLKHAEWASARIEIPQSQIILAESPADQAAAIMTAIERLPLPRMSQEIAIAVPDPEVAAEVSALLPSWGMRVTTPPSRTAADTSLALLLKAMHDWIQQRTSSSLSVLVRHPDIERFLDEKNCLGSVERTSDFESFGASGRLPAAPGPQAMAEVRGIVTVIDELLKPLSAAKSTRDRADSLRMLLTSIYPIRTPVDRDAAKAAIRVVEEIESLPDSLASELDAVSTLQLVREGMRAVVLPSGGSADGIELMGWLDAGIADAPDIVLTGMNDGIVPEGMVVDPWLPDSVRARLGMPCAQRRQARDAWILHAMVSRKRSFQMISGSVTSSGEPMQPSRLLLGLEGQALAQRILWISSPDTPRSSASEWGGVSPSTGHFSPQTRPDGMTHITSIGVTAFRDWFTSPNLFQLKYDPRLKLTDAGSSGNELNAMGFGSLVHDALQRWGREEAERTAAGMDARVSEDEIAISILSHFDAVRNRKFMPSVRGGFEVQFAIIRERLRAFAGVQAKWALSGWKVLHAELAFEVESKLANSPAVPNAYVKAAPVIGPGGLRLTGRIDRVDIHEEYGCAALDYKTSTEANDPASEHRNKAGEWTDLQLPLYSLLLTSIGIDVLPPYLGYICLPSNSSSAAINLCSRWTPSDIATACEKARDIAACIEVGNFQDSGAWRPAVDNPFAALWCVGMRGLRPGVTP